MWFLFGLWNGDSKKQSPLQQEDEDPGPGRPFWVRSTECGENEAHERRKRHITCPPWEGGQPLTQPQCVPDLCVPLEEREFGFTLSTSDTVLV